MDGQKLNTKFINTMKVYVVNSSLFCLNVLIMGIVWIATTSFMYEKEDILFQLIPNSAVMYLFTYYVFNCNIFYYTYGCILDIYVAYTRILIFKLNLSFLRNTPVDPFNTESFIFPSFKTQFMSV